jgi:hypothetical protein
MEEGRANAQTDIDTLKSIPISSPQDAPELFKKLNDEVLDLISLLRKKQSIQNDLKIQNHKDNIDTLSFQVLNIKKERSQKQILKKVA